MKAILKEAKVCKWLVEPLKDDVERAIMRLSHAGGVSHVAVMPDVHLSGEVCVGTVLATESKIFPQAVGTDIGCGMTAIQFDCPASEIANDNNAAKIMERLYALVPANRQSRHTRVGILPQRLLQEELSHEYLEKAKLRDGLVQFGTLGRGNHFLEFQSDEQGRLWLALHSGSRGMGKTIVDHHLKSLGFVDSQLIDVKANDEKGLAYLNDQEWACLYAELNRLEIVDRVINIIKELFGFSVVESTMFSCDHNHVRPEMHFGKQLFVHRKGALSARQGELGIIPGSMGTHSFHTCGRGCLESLHSSSHGAGRKMSRTEARKKVTVEHFYRQMDGVWFDHRKSTRLVDEAPSAYKDIHSVMRAQKGLTRIVRKLTPVLSYKGN